MLREPISSPMLLSLSLSSLRAFLPFLPHTCPLHFTQWKEEGSGGESSLEGQTHVCKETDTSTI